MFYQFRIDGRAAGPVRGEWEDAVQDAVNDGYAEWADRAKTEVYLFATEGAEIARLQERDNE